MSKAKEEYIPFGEEWRKEVLKSNKNEIVNFHKMVCLTLLNSDSKNAELIKENGLLRLSEELANEVKEDFKKENAELREALKESNRVLIERRNFAIKQGKGHTVGILNTVILSNMKLIK